jgi:hypothetical protein
MHCVRGQGFLFLCEVSTDMNCLDIFKKDITGKGSKAVQVAGVGFDSLRGLTLGIEAVDIMFNGLV